MRAGSHKEHGKTCLYRGKIIKLTELPLPEGVSLNLLFGRIRSGWSAEDASSMPKGTFPVKVKKELMQDHPEYSNWKAMLRRVDPNKADLHPRYSGRGIAVCERWKNFWNFLTDMGPRPSPAHTIERLDNDGDYKPENCSWATKLEQNLNTKNTRLYELRGVKFKLRDLPRPEKVSVSALFIRLNKGWSTEEATTLPFRSRRKLGKGRRKEGREDDGN